MPYKTLSGESLLFAVKAEKIYINDKEIPKSVYIGSVEKINDDFQAIIHSEIIR